MATIMVIHQENDQFLELGGLVSSLDEADFFNAATVVATLKDRDGNTITEINGLVLPYIAASDGIYRGIIESTFNPAVGGGYTLYVVATEGAVQNKWTQKCKVTVRTLEIED